MKTVIFLSGKTMGDALASVGRLWNDMFSRIGYQFVEVNLAEPSAISLLTQTVDSGQVEAVVSFVGMAAGLQGATPDGKQLNFWQARGIPFLSLYGDSPAYFFDRHVLPGRTFAGLYGFPEHYAVRKRLPRQDTLLATIPPFVVDPVPKDHLDFRRKQAGKLIFLKNGNDPDQLLRVWSTSLSERTYEMLSDLACELASALDSPACTDIDHLVVTYFQSRGYDVTALTNLRIFFTAQLDDYCRRLKSSFIADALMDFPIEVHGYNWDHLNFAGKRAKLIPIADFTTSRALIRDALGVIDMSPNTTQSPHERACRAFGAYTLCLTNEQEYFARRFANHDSFTFRFDKESIRARVADVIDHPNRYVDLGESIAEDFRQNEDPDAAARFLLEIASLLRLETSNRMPGLQDYFAWPPSATATSA